MHLVPTYTLGVSIYCETNCLLLKQIRERPGSTGMPLDEDVWGKDNMTLAVAANFAHCIFWSL